MKQNNAVSPARITVFPRPIATPIPAVAPMTTTTNPSIPMPLTRPFTTSALRLAYRRDHLGAPGAEMWVALGSRRRNEMHVPAKLGIPGGAVGILVDGGKVYACHSV